MTVIHEKTSPPPLINLWNLASAPSKMAYVVRTVPISWKIDFVIIYRADPKSLPLVEPEVVWLAIWYISITVKTAILDKIPKTTPPIANFAYFIQCHHQKYSFIAFSNTFTTQDCIKPSFCFSFCFSFFICHLFSNQLCI